MWLFFATITAYLSSMVLIARPQLVPDRIKQRVTQAYVVFLALFVVQCILASLCEMTYVGWYADVVVFSGWLLLGLFAFAFSSKQDNPLWQRVLLWVHFFLPLLLGVIPIIAAGIIAAVDQPDRQFDLEGPYHLRIHEAGIMSYGDILNLYERQLLIFERPYDLYGPLEYIDSLKAVDFDNSQLRLRIWTSDNGKHSTIIDTVYHLDSLRQQHR